MDMTFPIVVAFDDVLAVFVWVLLWLLVFPLLVFGIWQVGGLVLSLIVIKSSNADGVVHKLAGGVRIAILCPTCDDFNADACSSLIAQTGVETELFVLDDSTEQANRLKVEAWAHKQISRVHVVRRENRLGFKAGNLNHWLHMYGDSDAYQYILVVDADEVVPPDFTHRLLAAIETTGATFAQGCHEARPAQTPFQSVLDLHVAVNWRYVVPARNLIGLPWMLGHGVLLRSDDLITVGGFPEVVSEDLALTIALAERGRTGVAVPHALAREEFPRSCAVYWWRLSRWISADVELVVKGLPRLWRTTLGLTAKADLTLRELRLPLLACGWLLLAVLSIHAVLADTTVCSLPSAAWLLLFPLLVPQLSVWLLSAIPVRRRLEYCLVMPFVAHAGLGLYPSAVWRGVSGCGTFNPTGSQRITPPALGLAVWEYASGAVFMAGGLHSANLTLMALGLAIFLAPLLRCTFGSALLFAGAGAFWTLILTQVALDCLVGHTHMEHLLPLAAMGTATD